MKIFDKSILALPLFEERHRALAKRLESWVDEQRSVPDQYAAESPSQRGKRYIRMLGEAGWLQHATGPFAEQQRWPDLRSICLIREAFAYLDDLLDFAFAIQGLAAAPIAWYGSDVQKSAYLPACSRGELIGSLALSEPECGSDLAAIRLRAAKAENGYAIDGTKTWISNGNIADFHNVLARTGEGPGAMGLSLLLVPGATRGVAVLEEIEMIAPRAFASLDFRGCEVPAEAVIGEPGMGFRYAMEILNYYRVSVGAAAIGFSRRAFRESTRWSKSRTVFGSKLIETQMAMDKLSNMALYLDSASLLVARAAWEFDNGIRDATMHSSMAKLYATEQAQKVIDDAMQLFGAAGLVVGSVTERLYRQIRSLRIYEGTSEIQKMIIARAPGNANA